MISDCACFANVTGFKHDFAWRTSDVQINANGSDNRLGSCTVVVCHKQGKRSKHRELI